MFFILALNPGSTSTKIGYYQDDHCIIKETLRHSEEETSADLDRKEQAAFRRAEILKFLEEHNIDLAALAAIVVRGGLLRPLKSGTYLVNDELYADLYHARYGWHASNLGSIIALPLARELEIPLYTVDPVTVDELDPEARYSGLKGIPRQSMSHALNMKAMARQAATRAGKSYEDLNLIVAHLGSGISVSAHRRGRMIDVNNANEEGPFSLERCGTLPSLGLVRLCFEGTRSLQEVIRLLTGQGGIFSYLGTKDFISVEQRIKESDEEALQVVSAMAYQVAKEIGAMSTVLKGEVDFIVLTGGMANAETLVDLITGRISFIAPVQVLAGEEELEALVSGALRVLRGEAGAFEY